MMWQGPELLQRCAERRADPDAVRALWADPGTLVLDVDRRGGLFAAPGGLRLERAVGEWDPVRHWLLGRHGGVAYFAHWIDGTAGEPLRSLGVALDDLTYELATTAVALANWHAREPFCGRCGHADEPTHAGWVRHCPRCGAEHFPRHDPAMIVAVIDADDRLLLAHQHSWPAGRFSVLAGFCEAGEALEQCVHREVEEEVGVRLEALRYLGSQPWPVPRSLMTAFTALAATTDLRPDMAEITDARWFTRAQYAAAVEAGELLRPASRSIAHWMIDCWLDGTLTWGPGPEQSQPGA